MQTPKAIERSLQDSAKLLDAVHFVQMPNNQEMEYIACRDCKHRWLECICNKSELTVLESVVVLPITELEQ